MIRVLLPHHLQVLAQVGREVQLELEGPPTLEAVLDALEARTLAYDEPLRVLPSDSPPEAIADARRWEGERPGRLFLEIRYV